jgi:hypothetical protein
MVINRKSSLKFQICRITLTVITWPETDVVACYLYRLHVSTHAETLEIKSKCVMLTDFHSNLVNCWQSRSRSKILLHRQADGWRCSNGVLNLCYCTVRPLGALWRLGVPLSSLYIWRLELPYPFLTARCTHLSRTTRTFRPLSTYVFSVIFISLCQLDPFLIITLHFPIMKKFKKWMVTLIFSNWRLVSLDYLVFRREWHVTL